MGCGRSLPREALLRFVRAADGSAKPDPAGHARGRGAYLCSRPGCAERVRDGRAFSRALRGHVNVGPETLDFILAWQRDASTK
ncbi:MAG: YlxR family protein [Thermoleophilaceae bacterium]